MYPSSIGILCQCLPDAETSVRAERRLGGFGYRNAVLRPSAGKRERRPQVPRQGEERVLSEEKTVYTAYMREHIEANFSLNHMVETELEAYWELTCR